MNEFKEGCTIVVIGHTGSGKSPWTKALADSYDFENRIVYDRQREYDKDKYTVFYELKYFREYIKTKKPVGSLIICEESTGFISAFKELEWSDFVTGIEHNLNIACFLFHSIIDAPQYVLRNSHYVVLFPTGDDANEVKRQRRKFYEHFIKPRKRIKVKDEYWNIPVIINNRQLPKIQKLK